MLQRCIGLSAVKICLKNEIVSYDVGNNTSLCDKSMEGQEIGVFGLSKKSGEHGVDSEDGGAAIGVDRVASIERSFFEVVLANEREDAIVEVEAIAGECGNMFGELRIVRVKVVGWGLGLRLRLLGLRAIKSGKGRFDAELAFATASFGGSFFGRGEGE